MTNNIILHKLNKIGSQGLSLCPSLLQKVGHKGRTSFENVLPLKKPVFIVKIIIILILVKLICLKNVLPCFTKYFTNKLCFY